MLSCILGLIILVLLRIILDLYTLKLIQKYRIESLERRLQDKTEEMKYYKSLYKVFKRDRDIFMQKYYLFKNSFLNPN